MGKKGNKKENVERKYSILENDCEKTSFRTAPQILLEISLSSVSLRTMAVRDGRNITRGVNAPEYFLSTPLRMYFISFVLETTTPISPKPASVYLFVPIICGEGMGVRRPRWQQSLDSRGVVFISS